MTTVVRHSMHRGVVLAAGVIVDDVGGDLVARLASLAGGGTELRRLGARHVVVRFVEPRRVDVDALGGRAIVAIAGCRAVLSSAPLSDRERDVVVVGRDDGLVVVDGGAARIVAWSSLPVVDVADLVDVTGFVSVAVRAPPVPVIAIAGAATTTSRSVFNDAIGITPAAPPPPKPVTPSPVQQAFASLLNRADRWLAWAASSSSSSSSSSTTSAPRPSVSLERRASPAPSSSWSVPLFEALRAAVHGLRRLAGLERAQVQYLADTLKLFDEGRFDEALRRAIPVGETPSSTSKPATSVPTARTDLTIALDKSTAGTSIGLHVDDRALLKQKYRAAAAALLGKGRVREAAYVHIELLDDVEAGLRVLEDHGEVAFAAELAEARAVDTTRVALLWLKAGDIERAVQLARARGTFAALINAVDRGSPRALVLRARQASVLVEAGDLDAAVEVLWAERALWPQALTIVEHGIASGARHRAALALRLLVDDVARFDEVKALVAEVADDDSVDGVDDRVLLIERLRAVVPSSSVLLSAPLARLLVPSVLRDQAARRDARVDRASELLLGMANDGALRLDVTALQRAGLPSPLSTRSSDVVLDGPAGHAPIVDVALLHKARFALALGETGVHVVSREGKTQTRLSAPATKLVVYDSFDHALGLVSRGSVWRATKLSFSAQRAKPWGDVVNGAFSDSTDGALWFVGAGSAVVALDLSSSTPDRALWRVSFDEAEPSAIARDRAGLAVASFKEWDNVGETWRWSLPDLTSRGREPVKIVGGPWVDFKIAPSGDTLNAQSMSWGRNTMLHVGRARSDELAQPGRVVAHDVSREHIAHAVVDGDDVVVTVLDTQRMTVATATVRGAREVCLRLQGRFLVVGDDRGRCWAIDLRERAVIAAGRATT